VEQQRQHIINSIDEEGIISLAQQLVRVSSANQPGEEEKVCALLEDYLKAAGISAYLDYVEKGRPNVMASIKGDSDGPVVLLNGHIDTVPAAHEWTIDPLSAVIRNGRLYGLGAVDMKGPVAAMIGAARALKDTGLTFKGEVKLAMVMGEEQGQIGIRHLVNNGFKADLAIVGEPTSLKPVIAHKGDFYIEITTTGRAAHTSDPSNGINAINKMMKVMEGLQELEKSLSARPHPLVGPPTISVGTIEGGSATCVVADKCTITVDRRVVPGETTTEVIAEFQSIIDEISKVDPEFKAEVKPLVLSPASETISGQDPAVKSLRNVCTEVLGKDPGVHGWPATCDANYLANDGGIPTIVFGPGDI